jgi:hypothetical protein
MSFTENIYLQKQLKLLQEENKKLRNILREYEFDFMDKKEIAPFDPENPERSPSTGEDSADILHALATDLYNTGLLKDQLPHPRDLSPVLLDQYLKELKSAVPATLHGTLEMFASHVLASDPRANLDLHNYGGVANTQGSASPRLSPLFNHRMMRMMSSLNNPTPPPPPI